MKLMMNDLVQAQLIHRHPETLKSNSRSFRILGQLVRMRFQLAMGLCIVLFLPVVARRGVTAFSEVGTYLEPAFTGTILAFLLGFYIFRKVAAFPGVKVMGSIVPSFTASYGFIVLFYLMLRLHYRIGELALSYIASIVFFLSIFFLLRRVRRPLFAVIPGGRAKELMAISSIDWMVIPFPKAQISPEPIVVDLDADLSPEWMRFIADAALDGHPVFNMKQTIESLTGRVQIEHISENVVGALIPNQIWSSTKRYADFVIAFVALLATTPLLLAIAIIIRVESRGSAIYTQQRIGVRGLPFTIYKFRTMRMLTADEEADNSHTHDEDRITKFGAFLRRTRLDGVST